MSGSPVAKKRKLVILRRNPVKAAPVASVEISDSEDETDLYDFSAHTTTTSATVVEPQTEEDAIPVAKVEKVAKKEPIRAKSERTRSTASSGSVVDGAIELSSEAENDMSQNLDSSDSDSDSEEHLRQAVQLVMQRRKDELLAQKTAKMLQGEEVQEVVDMEPVAREELDAVAYERPKKKDKKDKGYRLMIEMALPVIDGHRFDTMKLETRSRQKFRNIEEKVIPHLLNMCTENNLYPPAPHNIEKYIMVYNGVQIFPSTFPESLHMASTETSHPLVIWLNETDAQDFRDKKLRFLANGKELRDQGEDEVSVADKPASDQPQGESGSPNDEEELDITLSGKGDRKTTVTVSVNKKLRELANYFAKKYELPDTTTVELYFDGDKVDLDSTVQDADIEDEDMLEVRLVE